MGKRFGVSETVRYSSNIVRSAGMTGTVEREAFDFGAFSSPLNTERRNGVRLAVVVFPSQALYLAPTESSVEGYRERGFCRSGVQTLKDGLDCVKVVCDGVARLSCGVRREDCFVNWIAPLRSFEMVAMRKTPLNRAFTCLSVVVVKEVASAIAFRSRWTSCVLYSQSTNTNFYPPSRSASCGFGSGRPYLWSSELSFPEPD